jgi:transcriptional antiterminator RfaH
MGGSFADRHTEQPFGADKQRAVAIDAPRLSLDFQKMDKNISSQEAPWYVIFTRPKQEFRALENLQNQGYMCFLPLLQKRSSGAEAKTLKPEPLFARYLFVQLSDEHRCRTIHSTRGVVRMVAFGGRYATLSDACVKMVRHDPGMEEEAFFQCGDRVRIIDGPFAGLDGIYQITDANERAMVLVDFLMRPQKLKFAMEQLEKC